MTDPEKLSVLLPVYNTRSDWLTVAVESVLNQTYREFELLLLNDGSTNPDTSRRSLPSKRQTTGCA